jgi:hypothetical protein
MNGLLSASEREQVPQTAEGAMSPHLNPETLAVVAPSGDVPSAKTPERPILGKLAFRIMPNAPDASQKPTYPTLAGKDRNFAVQAIKELAEKGPDQARLGGKDFQWIELGCSPSWPDAVIGKYKDKTYVLLCAGEPYVLLPKSEGADAWGLRQVSVTRHEQSGTAIGVRFDRRGGELFGALTRQNLHNNLAIIVADRVIAIPRIQTEIRDRAEITGGFTDREIDDIVKALKVGLRTNEGVKAKAKESRQ